MRRKTKIRTLNPVNYNAGNMAWYSKELEALIKEMAVEVKTAIIPVVQANPIAMDASPVQAIRHALQAIAKRWIDTFISRSSPMAEEFADKTGAAVDRSLLASARKDGLTINMQWTPAMMDVREAVVAENVALIKSIPEQYFTQVESMVMRSISKGGDLKTLTDDLQQQFGERHGITRRRAENIARDQVRKSTTDLSRARQKAAGITRGIWLHSGGGNEPRPKHKKANGQEFDLDKGLPIGDNNEYVLPGDEISCGCSWKPVIPF